MKDEPQRFAEEAELLPAGIGERLSQAIRDGGFASIADFARNVGMKEGLIRQHIHRSAIPSKYVTTYTTALKVTPEWLLDGIGTRDPTSGSATFLSTMFQRARRPTKAADSGRSREAGTVIADPPIATVGERDLPVYGSAQGGKGMTVDPHPLEWVKRPAPLMSVSKGFAVYVVGDSMSPAYEQGDMVFVHPGLPLNRGDDALLVNMAGADGEWSAIVKRVIGWSDKFWKLQQFNPRRDFDEPRAAFPQAYRIVGKYNRR